MKIKSGKIKNISKKIIAGALTFALVTIPLTGCDSISIDSIQYVTNKDGESKYLISNEVLEYCSFYKVYNNKTNEGYYTIGLQDVWNDSLLIKYYDIFTKEELTPASFAIKSLASVKSYLTEDEVINNEYREEELKEILNKFIETQEKNKKLVKE